MRTLVILAWLLLSLSGCEEQSEPNRREVAAYKAEQEQTRAKRDAEYEKEHQLMLTPAAIPELERRLDDWLRMTNGILLVKNEDDGLIQFAGTHAVSPQTPWVATCAPVGLEVVLGSWAEVEVECSDGAGGTSVNRLSRRLTKVILSESECAPLLIAVGQKMSQIVKGTQ